MHEVLWVCRTQQMAEERRKLFSDPSNVTFKGVCSTLAGQGFDEIIIETWDTRSEVEKAYEAKWLKECLPTKLCPKGRIMILGAS